MSEFSVVMPVLFDTSNMPKYGEGEKNIIRFYKKYFRIYQKIFIPW